ncbi:MAG: hypothetical protein U0838_17750 [Chloroflexota bacterium]
MQHARRRPALALVLALLATLATAIPAAQPVDAALPLAGIVIEIDPGTTAATRRTRRSSTSSSGSATAGRRATRSAPPRAAAGPSTASTGSSQRS